LHHRPARSAHVEERHGLEIAPDRVSAVTDSVLENVSAWQGRGLGQTYAIVFFDAIRVKIRNRGTQDILIALVAGLKGFPDAITAVFPKTVVRSWRQDGERVIPLLCVRPGGPPDSLRDERDREHERNRPQSGSRPWPLSERRGGDEADLARSCFHRVGSRRTI
jgi:hypothetical protein